MLKSHLIMKTIFLCTPHKLGALNHQLIKRIKDLGFRVTCAVTHTPQDIPYPKMFKRNIELIKKANIFVAVLKDYGKDLTAETGIAYGLGKIMIGINFNANKKDVMSYYAFNKIIKPKQLEKILSKYLP